MGGTGEFRRGSSLDDVGCRRTISARPLIAW